MINIPLNTYFSQNSHVGWAKVVNRKMPIVGWVSTSLNPPAYQSVPWVCHQRWDWNRAQGGCPYKVVNKREIVTSRYNGLGAIAAAQQGSQPDLAKVTQYLQAAMKQDPAFAQEVERLAGQVVNVSSIADQRTLNQKSDRSSRTVQVKAETTGDIMSDIKADSIGRIGGKDTHYH